MELGGRDLLEQGQEERQWREPRSWGVASEQTHCSALAMLTFQSLLLLRLTVKPLRQLTKLIAAKKKVPIESESEPLGPTAHGAKHFIMSSVMVKSTGPLINGYTQATKQKEKSFSVTGFPFTDATQHAVAELEKARG